MLFIPSVKKYSMSASIFWSGGIHQFFYDHSARWPVYYKIKETSKIYQFFKDSQKYIKWQTTKSASKPQKSTWPQSEYQKLILKRIKKQTQWKLLPSISYYFILASFSMPEYPLLLSRNSLTSKLLETANALEQLLRRSNQKTL